MTSPRRPRTGGWKRATGLALAALLLFSGCADDEPASDDADGQAAEPTEDDGEDAAGDAQADGDVEAQATTVTAVDYAYPDAPEQLAAGTTVTLENDSESEAHEIIALRVTDDEDRPAEELVQLPPEELLQVAEMRGVALAPPGSDSTEFPATPLTLEQPGRYLFVCLLPTGAPPDEVMQAAREFAESGATEGAPAYPETGPPHVAQGMFTEVEVTADG